MVFDNAQFALPAQDDMTSVGSYLSAGVEFPFLGSGVFQLNGTAYADDFSIKNVQFSVQGGIGMRF